jgi:hypothetical protein
VGGVRGGEGAPGGAAPTVATLRFDDEVEIDPDENHRAQDRKDPAGGMEAAAGDLKIRLLTTPPTSEPAIPSSAVIHQLIGIAPG